MQIIDKFMLRSMLCSSSVEQEWWTRGWGIPAEDAGEQGVAGTGQEGARADARRTTTRAGARDAGVHGHRGRGGATASEGGSECTIAATATSNPSRRG